MAIAGTAPAAWLLARTIDHADRRVFAWTAGRQTLTGALTGLPLILLTTTGARSGCPRTVPLVAVPMEDQLVVLASNYGSGRHPGWYHNVRANPSAHVQVPGAPRHPVTARILDGPERDHAWELATRLYPGWARYAERTRGRRIPVLALTPRDAPG